MEVVDVVVTVEDAAGAGSRSLAHSIAVKAPLFGGSRSATGLPKTGMFMPRDRVTREGGHHRTSWKNDTREARSGKSQAGKAA